MARWVEGALGVTTVAVAVGSFLSCRQIVGIKDTGGTSACGLPFGTSACAGCAYAHCCGESNTCSEDPSCSGYETCLGSCNGNPECRSQCTLANPSAIGSDVSALSACLASHCETECGLTCGGFASLVALPDAAASCETCTCATAQACAQSQACDAYWRCYRASPGSDGESYCGVVHDAGYAAFLPFANVYSITCKNQCGAGTNWSCVDQLSWPSGPSSSTLTGSIADPLNAQAPLDGVTVVACASCPCVGPDRWPGASAQGPEASTNDAGVFSVSFQTIKNPDGVALPECLQFTSDRYVPELSFAGTPVSVPAINLTTLWYDPGPAYSVFSPEDIQTTYQAVANSTPDPNDGIIVGGVGDCLGHPAPNVRITLSGAGLDSGIDGGVVRFYGNPPYTTLSETVDDGIFGFLGVSAGTYAISATPVGRGQPVSQQTIVVQAGGVTEVSVRVTQ